MTLQASDPNQLKNQLLQELDELPTDLLTQTLDFVTFLKMKQSQNIQESSETRPSTATSLLKHSGIWAGDDIHECLEDVRALRE
jgi:Protein of unknown function (DUF2281)